ncbi:MAG: SDR family oxidoreductase [Candidatus Rokubacteria bacterium]|nr:SDR family oxidoreductase [Candidatus Rokubacteria bacterium]
MGRLDGRVALVTGAARTGSIGRAIAVALAHEGSDIAVNDLGREREAEEVAEIIRGIGRKALIIPADVSKVSECQRMVQETVRHFGRLDILVNNAGGGRNQRFEDISESDYDQQLDLHLKGPFFAAQAAVPHMQAQGYGRIVNISSHLAYVGFPTSAHYVIAKAALRTLTKCLALALAPGITVNAVCPGPTATERFKARAEFVDEDREKLLLKRWGRPEDVARSVLFLVSPDGDAYTGQTLDPNCGAAMP